MQIHPGLSARATRSPARTFILFLGEKEERRLRVAWALDNSKSTRAGASCEASRRHLATVVAYLERMKYRRISIVFSDNTIKKCATYPHRYSLSIQFVLRSTFGAPASGFIRKKYILRCEHDVHVAQASHIVRTRYTYRVRKWRVNLQVISN